MSPPGGRVGQYRGFMQMPLYWGLNLSASPQGQGVWNDCVQTSVINKQPFKLDYTLQEKVFVPVPIRLQALV